MRSGKGTCYNCSGKPTKPSTPDLTIGTRREKTLGPAFSAVTTIAKANRTNIHKEYMGCPSSSSTLTCLPHVEEDSRSPAPYTVLDQPTICPHLR
uniref:Uncharacterized protein n=1 Tax=Neovison vison TaxID=452646 RepID=A0A8C7BZ46_NEOVI